ncbi:hypothetical protein ACP179_19730 [Xenorhabdus stockiae]|uniref:hypothetical protein n=1 Tax=Xenorhabdus stockiae TaxID=351614 RepID=UPI003CEE3C03
MKNKPDYCPEWFDLDNYDICHKFNRIAWWHAIMQRKVMIANDLKKSLSSGISRDLCYKYVEVLFK